MDNYHLAGYRIVKFSLASRNALNEIAERLIPHEDEILDSWVRRQYKTWQPPGLTKEDLRVVFGGLLRDILHCMDNRKLEVCIGDLEEAGSELAKSRFPFEALIISIHFLEESYLPFLLDLPSEKTQDWLIGMDEFLHAALAAVATAYFEAYRKELLEQAEVGRIVQEGLLADIPKKAADLEIAHIYISAREQAQLGGDFLDFFTIDSRTTGFIIGDLSGHGVEAAADSVKLRSLFKGFMRENPDPADAMARLNRVLFTDLESGLFATALAITYDLSGKMRLVGAGHPYPILCNNECELVTAGGMALAVDNEVNYSSGEIQIEPGGVFVAYTDGILEARTGKEIFGEERIIEAIKSVDGTSARAVAEHLVDQALRFAGGKFSDDVAVLVLKRHPAMR